MSERNLFFQVIVRAVQDAMGKITNADETQKAHIQAEARRWLSSPSEEALSFNWYCLQLGVDRATIIKAMGKGRYGQE